MSYVDAASPCFMLCAMVCAMMDNACCAAALLSHFRSDNAIHSLPPPLTLSLSISLCVGLYFVRTSIPPSAGIAKYCVCVYSITLAFVCQKLDSIESHKHSHAQNMRERRKQLAQARNVAGTRFIRWSGSTGISIERM